MAAWQPTASYESDRQVHIMNNVITHDLGGWGSFLVLRESLLARIFGHMVQLATPVVNEYHGDLFHDAEWLRKNVDGPCSFDFLVRYSGTNLNESARHMSAAGAPGGVLYNLTVSMEDRGRWSLTVTDKAICPVVVRQAQDCPCCKQETVAWIACTPEEGPTTSHLYCSSCDWGIAECCA